MQSSTSEVLNVMRGRVSWTPTGATAGATFSDARTDSAAAHACLDPKCDSGARTAGRVAGALQLPAVAVGVGAAREQRERLDLEWEGHVRLDLPGARAA